MNKIKEIKLFQAGKKKKSGTTKTSQGPKKDNTRTKQASKKPRSGDNKN